MPTVLTRNASVLKFDSISVAADLIEINMTVNNDPVDVTRGNQGHAMYERGLSNTDWKIMIAWTDNNWQTIANIVRPGNKATLEYGPEGAAPGKAKHVQVVIFESVDIKQSSDYQMVQFDISAKGAEAPTVDMYNGGVY